MLKKYIEEVCYKKSRKVLFGKYYESVNKKFLIEKHEFLSVYFVTIIGNGDVLLLNELVIRPKRYYYA